MTASLFVTGTPVVWTGHDPRGAVASGSDVVHAVARPAVDGLESSVCGQLVAAAAGHDWAASPGATRCEECARIADYAGGGVAREPSTAAWSRRASRSSGLSASSAAGAGGGRSTHSSR